MDRFLDGLVSLTERILTARRRRALARKEKQRKKHPVVDWLEAFLWAAGVVLLINQYLFQAYQIPSSSMEDTLLISDRIFVDKFSFGPELLPGIGKLPGFAVPERTDVIIFQNPSYISRGPAFNVLQRVVYMLTLSFVDIDRDEQGLPKAQFLIKRAVGVGGDRVRFREGNLEVRPAGEGRFIPEAEFQRLIRKDYRLARKVRAEDYEVIAAAGAAAARQDMRRVLRSDDVEVLRRFSSLEYVDGIAFDYYRSGYLYAMNPADRRAGSRWRSYEDGTYIPQGRLLPLGDNRDNSRDGRYFGPIARDQVLGKAGVKYWPLGRIGPIR